MARILTRPWWLVGGCLLIAVGLFVFASGTVRYLAVHREAAFSAELARVSRLVGEARARDAERWARGPFRAAEAAFRSAQIHYRLEEARASWWLPDFSTAGADVERARGAAERAIQEAEWQRRAARSAAERALALARGTVGQSDRLAAGIHLGPARRRLLGEARLAVGQAALLHEAGDYHSARARADRAARLADAVQSHAAALAARFADPEHLQIWQHWIRETVEESRRHDRAAIVVSKAERRVLLYEAGRVVRSYAADMGYNWIADKVHAGDGATPEGRYRVTAVKGRGASSYYKALLLDYPNDADRRAFRDASHAGRLPPGAGIGGLIEIHGEGGRGRDWTQGCVALSNVDLDDLWQRVGVGTPVTIVGTRQPLAIEELLAPSNASVAEVAP